MSVKCEGWSRSKPTAASRRDGSGVVAALRRGQQRQALTSRYSGGVSRLSLSLSCLIALRFSFLFFFCFSVWRLESSVPVPVPDLHFWTYPLFFFFFIFFSFFFFFVVVVYMWAGRLSFGRLSLHVSWPAWLKLMPMVYKFGGPS